MIPLTNKHPAYFQHIMCDIETTGVKPDRNHIIQICAVRFNLKTGEYDPNLFEVCLNPNTASWRSQDPSTMTWWQDPERQPIYDSIIEKSLDSKIAIQAFAHWLGKERLVFWGNRNGFDYMFLQSYFADCGVPFPFKFWDSKDLLSYTEGLCNGANVPFIKKSSLEFVGQKHNAIDDTLHQLKYLLHVDAEVKAKAFGVFDVGDGSEFVNGRA
jgi:DNA polymerase III epsilon subunit-like protein